MRNERLLTVEAAAERLSTSPRFIRRLIAERRIEFVKVGRHVRISESVLDDFIKSGVVMPMTPRNYSQGEVAWRNCQYLWMRNFRQRRRARHRSGWVMRRLLLVPDLRDVPRASRL